MIHRKLRAIAVVVVVAALLTGMPGLVNMPEEANGLSPALNRLIVGFRGGAQENDAAEIVDEIRIADAGLEDDEEAAPEDEASGTAAPEDAEPAADSPETSAQAPEPETTPGAAAPEFTARGANPEATPDPAAPEATAATDTATPEIPAADTPAPEATTAETAAHGDAPESSPEPASTDGVTAEPAKTGPTATDTPAPTAAMTTAPASAPEATPGARTPAPTDAPKPTPASPILIGNVNIAISGSDDDPSGGGENRVENIAPNQRIPRDFHVENRGSADVCVFMTLTVPYVIIATQADDGSYQPPAARPLYRFTPNDGWVLIESRVAGSSATLVYAWASGDGAGDMTPLRPGQSTAKLFDELVTANYVEGSVDRMSGRVVAKAHAIQARNLGDSRTPAELWALLMNGED